MEAGYWSSHQGLAGPGGRGRFDVFDLGIGRQDRHPDVAGGERAPQVQAGDGELQTQERRHRLARAERTTTPNKPRAGGEQDDLEASTFQAGLGERGWHALDVQVLHFHRE